MFTLSALNVSCNCAWWTVGKWKSPVVYKVEGFERAYLGVQLVFIPTLVRCDFSFHTADLRHPVL